MNHPFFPNFISENSTINRLIVLFVVQKRQATTATSGICILFISVRHNMDVSENSGTPQIIHFNRVFHYKPSILGYHYFWKHPYEVCTHGFSTSTRIHVYKQVDGVAFLKTSLFYMFLCILSVHVVAWFYALLDNCSLDDIYYTRCMLLSPREW